MRAARPPARAKKRRPTNEPGSLTATRTNLLGRAARAASTSRSRQTGDRGARARPSARPRRRASWSSSRGLDVSLASRATLDRARARARCDAGAVIARVVVIPPLRLGRRLLLRLGVSPPARASVAMAPRDVRGNPRRGSSLGALVSARPHGQPPSASARGERGARRIRRRGRLPPQRRRARARRFPPRQFRSVPSELSGDWRAARGGGGAALQRPPRERRRARSIGTRDALGDDPGRRRTSPPRVERRGFEPGRRNFSPRTLARVRGGGVRRGRARRSRRLRKSLRARGTRRRVRRQPGQATHGPLPRPLRRRRRLGDVARRRHVPRGARARGERVRVPLQIHGE